MIRFRSNYRSWGFLRFRSAELSTAILDLYLAKYIALVIFRPIKLIFPLSRFNLSLLGAIGATSSGSLSLQDWSSVHYLWLVRAILFMVRFLKGCQIFYGNQNQCHLPLPPCQHPERCTVIDARSLNVGAEARICLQGGACRWTWRLKVSELFGIAKLS